MKRITVFALLAAGSGCTDSPTEPVTPKMSQTVATTAACPLADVPAGANIVLCFETTLQPGVWHGWIMELSEAQPPTEDGLDVFDRNRINHPYVLASPEGFTRLTDPYQLVPLPNAGNTFAFQPEWNGTLWFDVLRLMARADGPPQNVAVVVFWADAPAVGADIAQVIDELLASGSINSGQATALTRKIDQALQLLERGKDAEAIDLLENFIEQVEDLAEQSVLSADEASALIERAEYMIDVI